MERILRGEEEIRLSRSSDPVDAWIVALTGGPAHEDNLNAPNIGQVPQLPEGAIVETRGILDGAGFHPLASPMPAQLEALIRPHTLREELAVDAGLGGDFDKALAAMTSDPLLHDGTIAKPLLEEMLAATREWLPQFHA
jgi:alpha-galactosidase